MTKRRKRETAKERRERVARMESIERAAMARTHLRPAAEGETFWGRLRRLLNEGRPLDGPKDTEAQPTGEPVNEVGDARPKTD